MEDAVDAIEIPRSEGGNSEAVSGLAVARNGLIAALQETDKKVYIYNDSKELVHEFPVSGDNEEFSYANQMILDQWNNLIICIGDGKSLLRYTLNGKKLPSIQGPDYVYQMGGVTMATNGDLYVSSNDPSCILKLPKGSQDWEKVYSGKDDEDSGSSDEEDEDENDDDEYDPKRQYPGQLALGPDGFIYIATENCINVLDPSTKSIVRQIGVDMHKEGNLSKIEGVCVTGDGYVFGTDQDGSVCIFKTDGSFVKKFGGSGDEIGKFSQPWAVVLDYHGFIMVSDINSRLIHIF